LGPEGGKWQEASSERGRKWGLHTSGRACPCGARMSVRGQLCGWCHVSVHTARLVCCLLFLLPPSHPARHKQVHMFEPI